MAEQTFTRFDPKKMPDNSVCCFIGKRRSGKSTLLADIMWHKRHIGGGIAMSGTEEGNGMYGQYIPKKFVFKEFEPDIIDKCIRRQSRHNQIGKRNNMFVVADDLNYDKKLFNHRSMRELFMNGRHYNMLILITLQYLLDIPPALRTNIDYVFLCKDNVKENKERMWRHYAGCFDSYKAFNKVFEELTDDYKCMVIDMTAKSSKLTDVIFFYKAELRKPFKTGSQSFWQADRNMRLREAQGRNNEVRIRDVTRR